jgi:hypothetical protein
MNGFMPFQGDKLTPKMFSRSGPERFMKMEMEKSNKRELIQTIRRAYAKYAPKPQR